MALHTKGKYHYGDSQSDLHEYLSAFSTANEYTIDHYANALCSCGNLLFQLQIDDQVGVALRICSACNVEHYVGDSDDFDESAELESCECVCGKDIFEITVGVALYHQSEAVKWVYFGARCVNCGLVGCYGDWKNEFESYTEYLANI